MSGAVDIAERSPQVTKLPFIEKAVKILDLRPAFEVTRQSGMSDIGERSRPGSRAFFEKLEDISLFADMWGYLGHG
jgi:hypothetical protein